MTQSIGRSPHKKRHGHHQKRSGHFLKVYHPFLPLLVLVTGVALLFSAFGPTKPIEPIDTASSQTETPSVLAYATNVSSSDLLTYTNQRRAKANVKNLSINGRLAKAAQAKANDMANRNYWSHNTPDGTPPWKFITNAGYSYSKAGENLACGFNLSKEVIDGWYASKSHKDNLIHPGYTEVGFGIADADNYNCGDLASSKRTIIVAMYGTPYKKTATTNKESTSKTPAKKAIVSSSTKSSSTKAVTEHSVTVNVVDADGAPVKNIDVTIHSTPRTGKTNDKGQVTFNNVETGPHTVTVELEGAKSIVNVDLTNKAKSYKVSIVKPELSSNQTSLDGSVSSTVAKPSNVSRLDLLTNGWTPLVLGFLSVAALVGVAYMVIKHSIATHRFIVKGEKYIMKHKLVDVAVVLLLVALYLLTRSVGVIL